MKDKLKDQERKFDQQESRIQDLIAAITRLRGGSPIRFPSSSSSHAPNIATCRVTSSTTEPRQLRVYHHSCILLSNCIIKASHLSIFLLFKYINLSDKFMMLFIPKVMSNIVAISSLKLGN